MRYTNETFRNTVFSKKHWIKEIKDEFITTKEKMTVICNNNHANTIVASNLVRDGRLNQCPICRSEPKEVYDLNPKLCKVCKKPIPFYKNGQTTRAKEFCSHSCSATFSNPNRKVKKYCLNCGKELTTRHQKKYCDNQCQTEYNYKVWTDSWLAGDIEKNTGNGFKISPYIRRYLYKKHNNSCSVCGWNAVNPHTGKQPLEVEHIDGNYRNNKEDNLTLLCPNCHSLTATYKGANKGNGREHRRKKE